MKLRCALALILLLVAPMAYSKDKRSKAEKQAAKQESNAREEYSRQVEIAIEQNAPCLLESFHNSIDGTRINNIRVVSRPGCGINAAGKFGGFCFPGDRTVLMI
jgi:hypothetical protein